MQWSVFIKDNDMETSSANDDDGPNCVSSCSPTPENFPTNLIWNFRRCFMVSLAQVLWRLKSMMFSVLFSTEKSQLRPAERLLCCNSVDYVYPSYLRRKDFDIFWDDRFHHISNIPTISTEYGHCIDWIYCGFWNQLQSSTAIQRYITKHQNFPNWNPFVKLKIRKTWRNF